MAAPAPVVSAVTEAFPGVSEPAVQPAATFLNLVLGAGTGLQTTFVNLGGVVLSLVSGRLAAKLWSSAYLTFAPAISGLIMSLRFMSDIEREHECERAGSADGRSLRALRPCWPVCCRLRSSPSCRQA